MRELQVGDRVDMHDCSYCFGVQNGEYTTWCDNRNGDREGLTVVKTRLSVLGETNSHTISKIGRAFDEVCDILVTNNDGGYWFTQSRFVNLCEPEHTVSFDGGDIVTISDQSYRELREHFIKSL